MRVLARMPQTYGEVAREGFLSYRPTPPDLPRESVLALGQHVSGSYTQAGEAL